MTKLRVGFLTAIEKAKRRIFKTPENTKSSPKSTSDFMFVKSGYKTQKVRFDEILYFEGLGDYIAIHTLEEKILTLDNMKNFTKTLPVGRFIRVHKSFIVSIEKIDFIEKNRIVIGKKYIPIGATHADSFWQQIKK